MHTYIIIDVIIICYTEIIKMNEIKISYVFKYFLCFLFFVTVCICALICVYEGTHMTQYAIGGQRTALGDGPYHLPCMRQHLFVVAKRLSQSSQSTSLQVHAILLALGGI